MKACLFSICLFSGLIAFGQYSPPAGQAGSTAIAADSAVFVDWAAGCTVVRGYMDISRPDSGYASVGTAEIATGMPGNGVLSLGDAGTATLTFTHPIYDGPGFDFAIFENSFSDDFLEFGFVEVSSDGTNFFRFPASSLSPESPQTASFGLTDATKVNNLAGKYRANYGTPFDLSELAGIPGLDIRNVKLVRIADVVGSIDPAYATYDKDHHIINDPWPTLFPSSGFDLDAVGVIHNTENTAIAEFQTDQVHIFGNPLNPSSQLELGHLQQNLSIRVFDNSGKLVHSRLIPEAQSVSLNELMELPTGNYVLCWSGNNGWGQIKINR